MPREKPDPGFWRGRRVLLTGHTGIKDSWLTFWLHHVDAEVTGISCSACCASTNW